MARRPSRKANTAPVSYAEIASKGPKQTPEEAAAPPLTEIEPSESAASTVSLIDVDTPSVHTVPADFKEQDIKTETEAERIQLEAKTKEAAAEVRKAAEKAKAKATKKGKEAKDKASAAADKAAQKAKSTDKWLTHQFAILEEDHPLATKAAVVANLAAVVGLGAFLGFRAWGLHERGQLLTWQTAATGAAVVGAVGVVEGTIANYFYKAQKE
ncbi:hypothetical protein F503_06036 [Ophiostoma piceae UAMH 11346]|uniref:Uncharacterized protein n=1 Tax=Ophiostoma piceae (strain UAMH 11346) TaxID=1262450 RepID=S3CFL4_OPHP1|nr:hypothetical protein F503_06036 [Ophiostoma piceae UAMH 11346]